jgi:cell division inhibitor SepF
MFEKWAETFKRKGAKVEDTELTFKEYNDEVIKEAPATEAPVYEEPKKQAPVTAGAGGDDSNIELKVVRPATFEEVGNIADYLLDGCTVVLNTELLDEPSTLRMLDFLNGVTYSTDGEIKNVSRATYIITPHNVDVSDDK